MIKAKYIFSVVFTLFLLTECCLYDNDSIPVQNGNTQSRYSDSEIEYFSDIALGSEYGNTDAVIRKWQTDIRIKINGNPTTRDIEALNAVMFDINSIIGEKINISIVEENPNIEIYFVPVSEFSTCNAVPGNYGYFNCKWNDNVIYRCDICIATDMYQEERSHMIREELTQSIGLMNDSLKYRNSIFYQEYSASQTYSEIDRRLIEILYLDEIKPGMGKEEVVFVLKE